MSIFKMIAGVIAIVTALGGYMSWKYSTTSACEAANRAIGDEMPRILEDLAERDPRFRALRVGGALFSGVETFMAGAAAQAAESETRDLSGLQCAYMVGQRELNPSGFREQVGDRLADQLAARLPF